MGATVDDGPRIYDSDKSIFGTWDKYDALSWSKRYTKAAIEAAVIFGRKFGADFHQSYFVELLEISRRLHRLDEHLCNCGGSARWDKAIARLERRASAIAAKFDAVAFHQGDPRGCALYIIPRADVGDGQDAAEYCYSTKGIAITT